MIKLKMPNTLALLFFLMALALAATWIIPQGQFDTQLSESGRAMVVPGSYQVAEEHNYLSPVSLFTAIPRAFADAQGIIFFLFIIGGVLAIIKTTGTVDALLGKLLESLGKKPGTLIFTVVFVFALLSSVMGASAEYIPFVLILVAMCRAMNLDSLTAVGIIIAGYGVGYGTAAFNQYTVVVANPIAGLDAYDGWPLRLAILVPFSLIAGHHIYRYSLKVKKNATASLVYGIEPPAGAEPPKEYPLLKWRHIVILLGFFAALGTAVWGIATRGWYLTELGAAFLILGVFTAIIGKMGPSLAAEKFVIGAKDLAETALLVGIARGIALIMEDGQILHTIVHGLSVPLSSVGPEVAGVGMMGMQTILNFFVPSGSGQAFVTMPLMAPLGDLVGVSRPISVLAFLFGDGFANILVPTNAVLMGILGLAGIPYDKWFKFCLPLLLKLLAAAAVVIVIAVMVGYA